MHEWALAESIVDASLKAAQKEGLKKLTEINVGIGELQQIKAEIIQFAIDEILKSSKIDTDSIKVNIKTKQSILSCRKCEHEWKYSDMKKQLSDDESESIHFIPEVAFVHTRCPKCGSFDFEIKSGRGVSITSIKGEK